VAAVPGEDAEEPQGEFASDTEETEEFLQEIADAGDWCCPRCLTVYEMDADVTDRSCEDCGVLLVEAGYTIACPACECRNSFANEACWDCDTPLRTEALLGELYPSAPWVGRTGAPARSGPLDRDAAPGEPGGQAPGALQPQRWCPMCRRGFPKTASLCYACNVALVESAYRIRCLSCNAENTIGSDLCWSCKDPLHPTADAGAANGPSSPRPPDLPTMNRPGTGSCAGSVLQVTFVVLLILACYMGRV
jgi:hypothetical protein